MARRWNKYFLFTLWVLCGALLLHLAGPAVYQAGISRVKSLQHSRIHTRNRQHDEEVMHITAASFDQQFTAREGELEIGGMRYDVVSHRREGNMVVCRVIKDEREQLLIKGMEHCADHKDGARFPLWQPVFYQSPVLCTYRHQIPLITSFNLPRNEWLKARFEDSYVSPPPDAISVCC